jgi:hypothetical protein
MNAASTAPKPLSDASLPGIDDEGNAAVALEIDGDAIAGRSFHGRHLSLNGPDIRIDITHLIVPCEGSCGRPKPPA